MAPNQQLSNSKLGKSFLTSFHCFCCQKRHDKQLQKCANMTSQNNQQYQRGHSKMKFYVQSWILKYFVFEKCDILFQCHRQNYLRIKLNIEISDGTESNVSIFIILVKNIDN